MSNTSATVAIALFMILTPPAASFARGGGGHGGGHAGGMAMGGFSRPGGLAGMGMSIGGIPRGIANTRGWNNAPVDYSGIGNAARLGTLPQPHIAAPTLPAGSRNPVAPPSMNPEQQTLMETAGGDRQPRADQVPSEKNLTNPNNPANREDAAIDRMLNICRGC